MIKVEVIASKNQTMDKIPIKAKDNEEGGMNTRDLNANYFIRKILQIKNKHTLIND